MVLASTAKPNTRVYRKQKLLDSMIAPQRTTKSLVQKITGTNTCLLTQHLSPFAISCIICSNEFTNSFHHGHTHDFAVGLHSLSGRVQRDGELLPC